MNNTCVGAAISRITTFVMTQTAKHRIEEIAVARVGAGYNLTLAGHDLKLLR
jgi:hypothetical protein